jgi:hypothetical protein
MCPVCIASTAVMIAGAGSAGGILALCIGRFRKVLRVNRLDRFSGKKEKLIWQQAKQVIWNRRKGIVR